MKTLRLASLALLLLPILAFAQSKADDPMAMPPQDRGAQGVQTTEGTAFRLRIKAAIDEYNAGRRSEAIAAFEALNKEQPEDTTVQSWLAFAYLRAERPAEAVPLLESAAKARPDDIEVLNNLGNAYVATGNSAGAIRLYERLATASPRMFEPHYNLGNLYLGQKDYPKAAAAYRQAIALKGDSATSYNNLGVASDAAKDPRAAAVAFKAASDLVPSSALYARNAGLTLAGIKSPNAAAYLERAIAAGSDEASVRLTLGQIYTDSRRYADAERLYTQSARTSDADPTYWYNLGVLRQRTGDLAGAGAAYRRSLELKPDDLDALGNYGLILFKQGRYEDARLQFAAQMKGDPNATSARRNYAAASAKAGRPSLAIPIWKDAIHSDPTNVALRLDLANALYAEGDVEGARYHYNKALALRAGSAEALNGVGLCHLHDTKLPQAEAAFRGAIQSDPNFVPAYNNLALVLEKLNRRPQALSLLERAARLDPKNADVQKNLRRLRADA